MQRKENKEEVFLIDDENNYGIGVLTQSPITIQNIRKINQTYIRYVDKYNFVSDETGEERIAEFICFENMPKNILESIVSEIKNKLENNNDKVDNILNFIINLFSRHKFNKKIRKQIMGDIGELIFMIKMKEKGFEVDKYYRKKEESLYDFNFKDFYVEIKSSTKFLNEITITERQVSEADNKVVVVSRYQMLEDKQNIFKLFEILNSSNPIILEKRNQYKFLYESDEKAKKIFDDLTVDLDNTECFVLEEHLLPKIKIIHNGGLKELGYKIDISSSQKINIDTIISKVNKMI